MLRALALCATLAAAEEAAEVVVGPEIPTSVAGSIFFEPFEADWESTWKVSKDADFSGRWKREPYAIDPGADQGLVVSDPARKHAVSTLFSTPVDPKGKGLVVQYELQLKNGLQCGGAYLKLLSASDELSADGFKGETPYTIMFGPDRCGDTNKVHFILRHKNAKSGVWEEKHLSKAIAPDVTDKLTHLYTAVVGSDNTVKILVDNVEKVSASLLSDTDFTPPVNPPKEIDDPDDKKPDSWIDDPKMDEPGAKKPDDWDEDAPRQIADPKSEKPADWLDDAPDMIPDPNAAVPSDWDADEDGEWEAPLVKNPDCQKHGCGEWKAPLVPNPDYKGKWSAQKVDNPDYKGVWAPRKIDNPNYVIDEQPHAMAPIGGIGIELWTMQDGILFDNILLTHDPAVAADVAKRTYAVRFAAMAEAKKKASRATEAGEGIMGKVAFYLNQGVYFVQDNLMMVGASVCLGLIPLLLWCCSGGSGGGDGPRARSGGGGGAAAGSSSAEAVVDDDEEDEEEEEEESEEAIVEEEEPKEEPKGKGKAPAKRRSKKAD